MVIFQWFERFGQTIAPDKNYAGPLEKEPSLLDILAPPSKELTSSSSPGAFQTPSKKNGSADDETNTLFSPPPSHPRISSVDDIPKHIQYEMVRAGLETKQVAMQSKNFQERLDKQFKLVASTSVVKKNSIEKFKEILKKDKDRVNEGSMLSIRFARTHRLYTQAVKQIPDGHTLLHVAAMYDQVEVAKALLQDEDFREEQLKRTNCLGENALHVAGAHGKIKMVDFLTPYYPEHVTDASGLTMYGLSMVSPFNKKKQEFDKYFSDTDPSVLTSGTKRVRVDEWEPLGVKFGMASITGKRIFTEDAHNMRVWDDENGHTVGFACVCDGHEDGGEVSSSVATWLPHTLRKYEEVSDWKERIEKACSDVDDELKIRHPKNGGSTAIMALLTERKMVVGNVGDSRCILIQRGDPEQKNDEDLAKAMANLSIEGAGKLKAIALSKDHVVEGEELERLKKEGASIKKDVYKDANGNEVTKNKLGSGSNVLAMSRSFGDFEFKGKGLTCTPEVVVRDRDFEKDEYLVLACDGVWDAMSNEEVARMIVERMATKMETNSETLTEVADDIAKQCLKSGDNISLLVLSLHDLPTPVASPAVLPVVASNVDSPQKAETKDVSVSNESAVPNDAEPVVASNVDSPQKADAPVST